MSRGVGVACAVVAGAAVGALSGCRAATALAGGVATAALAVAACRPRWLTGGLVLAAIGCLSTAHAARARDRALAPPLVRWLHDAEAANQAVGLAFLRGRLATDAELGPGGVELTLDASAIREPGRVWHPVSGRVRVRVQGDLAARTYERWMGGRTVTAPLALRLPSTLLNPGGPGLEWQQLRRGYDLAGTIKSAALIETTPGPWWTEAAGSVRRHVRTAVTRFVGARDATSAAIVAAILIGDRAGLDPAVILRLQRAGTYHVIAISGGNVALVAVISVGLLRWFVRGPRLVSLLTLAAVVAYAAIVRSEPSVERAVTAAAIYLACGLVGIVPRALPVLALTAAAVVAVDPLTVVDVGAWLSFGATLGIVVCASDMARWLRSAVGRSRVGGALAALTAATLAAELALAPVSVDVFGRVGVAGLLLNIVAIPAMAVVETSGLLLVMVGTVLPWLASAAGVVADVGVRVLVGSATLVDQLPWLSWRVPPSPLIWTVVYYVAAMALIPSVGVRRPVRRLVLAVWFLALVVMVSAPDVTLNAPRPGILRVAVIDVGQGDAIVVQFPGGHSLLVDTGGGPGGDVGARTVTPALWALGVRRLDWLAITHDDLDHIGGAVSVTGDLRPREIWEGVPVPRNTERRALHAFAAAAGTVWRQLQAGDRFEVDGATIEVRHPPLPDWERQRVRNDDSLVLSLEYGRVEVLLTGDAGPEFEQSVAVPAAPTRLRVLKVAHHGSRSSSSPAFVEALRPQIAIVSAGQGNPFGHPAPEVVARLRRAGAEIFRTDRDGAVVVETDGRSIDLATLSGRVWRVDGDWP